MRIVPAKAASVIGLRDPAAKGATVKGMSETATSLHRRISVKPLDYAENGIHTFRRSNDSCHESEKAWVLVLGHLLNEL